MRTAVAAAAVGHAAASLCFTIRAGQYNVLAANLASNIKPWFWYVLLLLLQVPACLPACLRSIGTSPS